MKVIVIGATGVIGKAVVQALQAKKHEVVEVGVHTGTHQANLTDNQSLKRLLSDIDDADGVVCVAGEAYAGPLNNMDEEDFYKGIKSKLMGQVNLTMIAKDQLMQNGFIVLTSGNLAEEPKEGSAGLGLVNSALNGFVINAALEMPRGIRLNVVSPSILAESVAQYGYSPGRKPIPAEQVAQYYVQAAEGNQQGQVIKAYGEPDSQ